MTDNQALLARLDKSKLDYLFSSVLGLVGEQTDVRIFEPESQHDGKWAIVARGHVLRVTEEMIGQLASYCDSPQMSLQWFDMVVNIVRNPNDHSFQLKPYTNIEKDDRAGEETNTLTGEDYENIDLQFMVIYASLKAYYETLHEVCQQTSPLHVTMSHNLSQDVALLFTTAASSHLDLVIINQDTLTGQTVNTISCLHNRNDFVAFFAPDTANGKTKAIPYGKQIAGCLDGMNNLLTDFLAKQTDPHKREYAEIIVNDFVTTLPRVGSFPHYYQFGDNIENVENHPEVMEVLDKLTVLLLNHVMAIPANAISNDLADKVSHYAFDPESLLIYAIDKQYREIGELTNPDYAIPPLLSEVSEAAFALLSVRLSELRNKHVIKKIGKLVMAENPNVLH